MKEVSELEILMPVQLLKYVDVFIPPHYFFEEWTHKMFDGQFLDWHKFGHIKFLSLIALDTCNDSGELSFYVVTELLQNGSCFRFGFSKKNQCGSTKIIKNGEKIQMTI